MLLLALMTPSMLLASCSRSSADDASDKDVQAEIVWKDGAQGIVTFVFDDGDHATADFVRGSMLERFPNLRASYALVAKRLADIQTTSDGDAYLMTDGGRYVYTLKDSEVEYWRSHLESDYCEFLSHSWTHDKWGQNDNGGEQTLTDYSGTATGTNVFPKGHITMELAASKQLLMDVFGQSGQYFVKPGTGMKEYKFYTDLLTGGSIYEGARSTSKALNDPNKLKGRYLDINSWMVAATESADQWNDFIDQAVTEGKWATFCIHNIVADDVSSPSGHYIYRKDANVTFAYANALASRGDVWIATLTEAANYIRLRNATKVSAKLRDGNSLSVSLRTSLGDGSFGDIALTVRVSVPEDWSDTVSVSDGTTLKVQNDGDESFVYLNASFDDSDRLGYVLTSAR